MSKKSRSGVLADHIREGKVFKPPISKISSLEETNWIQERLPEFLWLGLLDEYHGLSQSVDLAASMARAAIELIPETPKVWFATASSYSVFSTEQRKRLIRSLEESGKINLIREALHPLVAFYPECPLNFLFEDSPPIVKNRAGALTSFKDMLASMYNRRGRPAILVQAKAVHIAFVAEMLFIKSEMAKDFNLNSLVRYPETEESRKVGAVICVTCSGLFMHDQEKFGTSWANYFWNRGLELESCEYELPYEL